MQPEEGPFLAMARHGAHPLEHLCAPSLRALDERIRGFEQDISLMTLAPELPGSSEVIERLRALGIVICLGHSNADGEASAEAFSQGVGMLTHSFNAMPGLHHRAAGPVGEACTMAVLLQRLAPQQLVLVSDSLAPYGLKDGKYRWDERVLLVEKGTCRLEDGTLAGVTLPLLEGSRRLATWSGEPAAAIWAATMAPRQVMGNQWKPDAEELIWRHAA